MRTLSGARMTFADFDRYEDECISEEMLARLHNATEESVLALVAGFRANDRARLALYCYRRCTCSRSVLRLAPRAI